MKKVKIVCTRVLPAELKLQAVKKGVTVADSDFLKIDYLDNETIRRTIEDSEGEFVFTSVHAVKAVSAVAKKHELTFSRKICYSIAGPTSQLASASGFKIKAEAENALMLAKKIIKNSPAKLVLFAGDLRRQELEEILEKEKTEVVVQVVYEKNLIAKKVGSYDGVMFFSPSQVDAFLLENKLQPEIPAFCIGSTTGDYLKEKEHKNTIVAKESNSAAVLDKVYKYFKLQLNDN